MRWRAWLIGGLTVILGSCSGGGKSGADGDDGTVSMGGAGTQGGSGGTSRGGTGPGSGGSGQGGMGATNGDGGADGGTGTGGRDAGAGTVTGLVRTPGGSPNENVIVAIGSSTTYTDAEGRFEIHDAPAEYDVVLIVPTESYALVVRGVSERMLNLRIPGYELLRNANLTGLVTGIELPIPADHHAGVAYQDPEDNVFAAFGPDALLMAEDASYVTDLLWGGPASVSGHLLAIEYRLDAMYRPVSYEGFGSTPLELTDRTQYEAPATTVTLGPVASRTLTGTVTVPSGCSPRLQFDVGPFRIGEPYRDGDTYSIVLPTGLTAAENVVTLYTICATENATGSVRYVIGDSMTTLDLSVPAPPVPILPAEGVTDVDYETLFSWDAPEGWLSTLVLNLDRWRVCVVTDSPSTTIPDLTEYGISLSPGSQGYWSVDSVRPPATVDEWLRGDAAGSAKLEWGDSSRRAFTVAN